MLKVVIVDDRPNSGERVANRFRRFFAKNGISWIAEYISPLENKLDYNRFIIDNKIILILIDEKLDVPVNGVAVNYNGHDIVEHMRKSNKDLPIYIITAYPETEDLLSVEGQADGIISRSKFVKVSDSNQIITRLVRSTHRYLDNYSKEYARLATLSGKVVKNNATKDEVEELDGLRAKLDIENSSITSDRTEWLSSLDNEVSELRELIQKAREIISRNELDDNK